MWSLFALALSLSPAHVAMQDIPDLLGDTMEVVAESEDNNLFPGDEFGQYKTVRVLITWFAFESAGKQTAVGDGGRAAGRGQLHKHAWYGYSREQVLNDDKLDIRLSLRYMLELQKHFNGSLRLALQAYARGNAYKGKEAVNIVNKRCAISGC